MKGTLYLVATPIGNLEDITFRAIRTLKEVDLILAEDTRKTIKLLNHYDIQKPMISFYRHNEGVKAEYVLSLLEEGKNLALVSDAGTPAISDPGEDLVRLLIKHDIAIVPIPGSVACIQALICSGFDTTKFVFEGFLSINKRTRKERLAVLKDEERTMLFYEAPHKLKRTLADLKEAFGGERRIVLAREVTKIHEEFLRLSIDEAISYYEENEVKGEFVIVLEGAPKKEEVVLETVQELMDMYLKEGYDKKEAMKLVAKKKGISKSEVYKEIVHCRNLSNGLD
ncbi:MAG: 16S rRNA (cytidine(1402)-2'-O)-methyltransferase [Clostridia bacterium]|nr:16S rRNA (cytidine(1402)-2'-O)-methyltransferase [Clostridia bacterium]